MIDNTSRYKYFKENEAKIWRSRFEWRGEEGEVNLVIRTVTS